MHQAVLLPQSPHPPPSAFHPLLHQFPTGTGLGSKALHQGCIYQKPARQQKNLARSGAGAERKKVVGGSRVCFEFALSEIKQ